MINDIGFAAIRPYLAVILGILGNYLISRGFLEPQNLQPWVDGWIQIITAAGTVLIGAIAVYHEFRILMKKTLVPQNTATTTTTQPASNGTTTTQTTVTTPIQNIEPQLPEKASYWPTP